MSPMSEMLHERVEFVLASRRRHIANRPILVKHGVSALKYKQGRTLENLVLEIAWLLELGAVHRWVGWRVVAYRTRNMIGLRAGLDTPHGLADSGCFGRVRRMSSDK